MTPQQFDQVLADLQHQTGLKNNPVNREHLQEIQAKINEDIKRLMIFHEKAQADGDSVARLEEAIAKLVKSLKEFDHIWSADTKTAIKSRITEYKIILHGDKPDE